MVYKGAFRHGFFDLQTAWSWYNRRSEGRPNQNVLARFIEVETKILAPFTPHLAEEIWKATGHRGFVVEAPFPEVVAGEIDPAAEAAETLLQSTLQDVREILKVTGISPHRIALYVAPEWKFRVHRIAHDLARQGPIAMNVLMNQALAEPGLRERSKEVAAYAKRLSEDLRHTKSDELDRVAQIDELSMFRENLAFLTKEFGAPVDVYRADDPARWDPAKKADHAVPGRPAIFVE